ncbi:AmmeMemoRadiSam system protein B [Methylacidiphilum caldifontis]|uniref:AmmeMemoRadiSam system protein B n=1 Tax=Methylacidiphilum caldifontis TaxID=2795386 RepID=A0A4Y8PBP8_9BACT|nr:AmmeMemoRadiSam system protein B [Methylacidiphilum caldifontis]QSR88162.1 AmmeMemoRadiSam system protein B [Methylacidiphilum caldifontis]TFE68201.1 AmmeMemoRadiSam system protein B [Methylacidiphilum caldifontis]
MNLEKLAMQTRAIHASCHGFSYPAEALECLTKFRSFFDAPGACCWPKNGTLAKEQRETIAILAPHIDFQVSPKAYTYAFSRWFSMSEADFFIILGVGHHSRIEWSIDNRDYITPLGRAYNKKELVENIERRVGFCLSDPLGHQKEHSIEFPLVFMQALRYWMGIQKPLYFLPVLCGGLYELILYNNGQEELLKMKKLAALLREIISLYKNRVGLIISIDGCHIGPRFGHPFKVTQEVLKNTDLWEKELWGYVEAQNFMGFINHLQKEKNIRFFDGVGAIALTMEIFKDQPVFFRRTYYEQWFEQRDNSVVTFSSGYLAY